MGSAARGRIAREGRRIQLSHSRGPALPGLIESLEARRLLSVGDLDPTWGGDGTVTTDFPGSLGDRGRPVAVQADGKILQAGPLQQAGPGADFNFGIVRLNPDGSLDTTFGQGGRVVIDFDGRGDYVNAMAVAPDGKIVVAGNSGVPTVDLIPAESDVAVARLNPDGSLDTTFAGDGKVRINFGPGPAGAPASRELAWNMAVQPDGRIVVAGNTNLSGIETFALVRFNVNGSLDTTFGGGDGIAVTPFLPAGGGTPFGGVAYGIALDSTGRIVLSGVGGPDSSNGESIVARYNADGSFDTTFDADGWVLTSFSPSLDTAYNVRIDPDGKIVAAGQVLTAESPIDIGVARYNAHGSLDATFGTGGKTVFGSPALNEQVTSMVLDGAGGVLVTGRSTSSLVSSGIGYVARLDPSGNPDFGFGPDAIVELADLNEGIGIALQPADGYILISGSDIPPDGGFDDFALARLAPAGFVDTSFGPAGNGVVLTPFIGAAWNVANAVVVQPDGRVVVGGWVNPDNATRRDIALARYHPDGSLDDSFGIGGRRTFDIERGSDNAAAMELDAQRRIVGAGWTTHDNVDEMLVFRLNPDGTPDLSFGSGGFARLGRFDGSATGEAIARDLAVLPDGRIAVVGDWSSSSTNTMFAVALFDASGNLDPSFGGDGMVRVHAGAGTYSYATSVALLSDGDHADLIVGGTGRAGGDHFAVVRINPDGLLDSKLDGDGKLTTPLGTGSSFLNDIAVDATGRIVAAGYASVSTPTGTRTDFAVVRYLSGGLLDPLFDSDGKVLTDLGIGARDQANAILLGPDGRIYVGGFGESNNATSGSTAASRDFAIVRYDAFGQADATFGNNGRLKTDFGGDVDAVSGLALADGKLIAVGTATIAGAPGHTVTGTGQDFGVARYLLVDTNQTPVSRPGGPYAVNEGSPLTLSGETSTDDGTIVLYEWDFDYDHVNFTADAAGVTVPFPATDGPLSRSVALRVRDDDGVYKIAWTQLTVNNVAPAVEAGEDLAVFVGQDWMVHSTFTDPGADTWTATADYGDGAGARAETAEGGMVMIGKPYAAPGIYIVTVRVSDDDGGFGTDTLRVTVLPRPARVSRRDVFYNNSAFDGNDPAANGADFAAVATDKQELLPGQTATFANYTSYARGINGIILTIDGAVSPTVDDFVFRKGRDSTPADWVDAGRPSGFLRFPLPAGPGWTLVITFPDGAIRNTWLQVTTFANESTNLLQPDVHYWGNLAGEIGNGVTGAAVNVVDQARVRAAVSPRGASIGNPFDFDRNGKVDAADVLLCRANGGHSLAHITPASAPASASVSGVFHDGGPISRTLAPRRRQPLLGL